MPMTTSEISPLRRLRRSDRRPSPAQRASSTSACSPRVYLRSRYQAGPPIAPAIANEATRRAGDARSTWLWKSPGPDPKARCSKVCSTSIMRSPNRPVATPVSTSASQNRTLSGASPSSVLFGCSVAPRPEASRRPISGAGVRTRARVSLPTTPGVGPPPHRQGRRGPGSVIDPHPSGSLHRRRWSRCPPTRSRAPGPQRWAAAQPLPSSHHGSSIAGPR